MSFAMPSACERWDDPDGAARKAVLKAGDGCARAQITGVAFFDFLHGQTGVAPNGIELHPVLGFACLR
jgi:hypothetical protein